MRRELIHRFVDELFDLHENNPNIREARSHFRSARREVLLGVRSLIDMALEHSAKGDGQSPSGAKTIRVED
ncbi:MAG: hypothetical protein ACM3ZQ_04050 [Bacillota bacterium]